MKTHGPVRLWFSGRWLSTILLLLHMSDTSAAAGNFVSSQDKVVSQVKASYVYNFLKFVSFEQENLGEKGKVRLCLVGKGNVAEALSRIDGAVIPQGELKVVELGAFDGTTSLNGCNALYLSGSEADRVDEILGGINTRQVLTIGDFTPFINHGGLIELYERDDSIHFRINGELAKETEFKVAAQLVQLGVE